MNGIGEQRVDMLEGPARARLEGKKVGRTAKGRKQQHRQRHADQIDGSAGSGGEHQPGRDIEIVGLAHVRGSVIRDQWRSPDEA